MRAFLDSQGVPRSWYCIEGDRRGWESVAIEHVGDAWEVTFDNRGERVVLGSYATEDEACDFLAARMLTIRSQNRNPRVPGST